MDFIDKLNQHISVLNSVKLRCQTEEATKHSMVLPVINLLGYDVFNPLEVVPEFIADLGIKKGEKVDYAILDSSGQPTILIECKHHLEKLDVHHSQLFRYFTVTKAKFGILTNGSKFQFFSDLEESNKMDSVPFLEIDLENLKNNQIEELKKFTKDSFNPGEILTNASSLKYIAKYKELLSGEFSDPSDEFVKFFVVKMLDGKKITAKVLSEFSPIIKSGSSQYINEIVNNKLKSALKTTEEVKVEEVIELDNASGIVTTEEEMEAYYIIKSIAREVVEPNRVSCKDTISYFGIMLDGKVTKWFARFRFGENKKFISLATKNKSETRFEIQSIDEIYNYRSEILESIKHYLI